MDIRIDTARYSAPPPPPVVRSFAQANCASEVAPNSVAAFGQYPPAGQHFGQAPPAFAPNFYQSSSTFNKQQPTTPNKKNQQRNNNNSSNAFRGYDQPPPNFQRFTQPPPPQAVAFAPVSNSGQLTQPPFRRCNSMGVASAPGGSFRGLNAQPPQPPFFDGPPQPPPQPQEMAAYQAQVSLNQLPLRGDLVGRSRQQQQSSSANAPSNSSNNNAGNNNSNNSHQNKRYVSVQGGSGVQKSKKKYDRPNKNNDSYRQKPKDNNRKQRSQGYYDSSSVMLNMAPPPNAGQRTSQKRKWQQNSRNNNNNDNKSNKRYYCERTKKYAKWTECNARDIARVHRNCVENGQPLAPYNTTQFIMNEHMAGKEFDFDESSGQIQHHRRLSEGSDFDEAEEYSSPAEDEGQYMERQFNEAFLSVHRETLSKKSKDELVTDILVLEKKYTTLNKSHSSSIRRMGKRRAKAMRHRQTKRLLREMYTRHNRLAHSVQNLAQSISRVTGNAHDSAISSTSSTSAAAASTTNDTEISLERVKLEDYHLPDDLDYMVQYCIRDSESEDDDDSSESDFSDRERRTRADSSSDSSSDSSDCDSDEYSTSTDSSYGSDPGFSDVEMNVARVVHALLDAIELNFS